MIQIFPGPTRINRFLAKWVARCCGDVSLFHGHVDALCVDLMRRRDAGALFWLLHDDGDGANLVHIENQHA